MYRFPSGNFCPFWAEIERISPVYTLTGPENEAFFLGGFLAPERL
jgi:hypothetical protein